MSELAGQDPGQVVEGQPSAEPIGTPQAAPEPAPGQVEPQQSPDAGQVQTPADPTFFDPNSLTPELMPAYKQMQAAFTKKMQAISADRQKIEAYDAFARDPIGQMQNLASQYGYSLTRGQAQQMIQQQQPPQDWQPQTWDEVLDRAKTMAREEIMKELGPVFQNVQQMRAASIENQLTQIDPQWRVYEDEMRANLQTHPTLVNDVSKLYELSVPREILTSRAVQEALKKFEGKAQQSLVQGSSKTSRSEPAPPKVESFQDAVAAAREQGRREGWHK